jgi:hypothetical protein
MTRGAGSAVVIAPAATDTEPWTGGGIDAYSFTNPSDKPVPIASPSPDQTDKALNHERP